MCLGYIGHKLYVKKLATMERKLAGSLHDIGSGSEGVSIRACIRTCSIGKLFRSVERTISELSTNLSARRPFWGSCITTVQNILSFLFPLAVVISIGSISVGYLENWSWIDALYWCTMTGTTVG